MLTNSVLNLTKNTFIKNHSQVASAMFAGKSMKVLNNSPVKVPKNSFSLFGDNSKTMTNKTFTPFEKIKGNEGRKTVARVICYPQLKSLLLQGKIEYTDIGKQPNKPHADKLIGEKEKKLGNAEKELLEGIKSGGVNDKKGLYLLTDNFLQNVKINRAFKDPMSLGTDTQLAHVVGSVMQKPNVLMEFPISVDENVVLKEKGNNSCVLMGTTDSISVGSEHLKDFKFYDTKTFKRLSLSEVKARLSLNDEPIIEPHSKVQINCSNIPSKSGPSTGGMFGGMFSGISL